MIDLGAVAISCSRCSSESVKTKQAHLLVRALLDIILLSFVSAFNS